MNKDLIIDNVGFDVPAMAKLSEKEFIETHQDNDAICRLKSPDEKNQWLKEAYVEIKKANAAPPTVVEDKTTKKEKPVKDQPPVQ